MVATIAMVILTPFIHHVVRDGQMIFGGECIVWMFPLLGWLKKKKKHV